MIATLRLAAPAALLIGVLGCGQEGASSKAPPSVPPKTDGAVAALPANMVTLKVEGMV